MAGLIGSGLALKEQTNQALNAVADMEQRRKQEGELMKQADRQQKGQLAGLGAVAGWQLGAQAGSIGGPWGMAIGAAAGYLLGELF